MERTSYEQGEYIVLTGSTSGIGYEYLKLLVSHGLNVITVSNEAEKLESQAKLLKSTM